MLLSGLRQYEGHRKYKDKALCGAQVAVPNVHTFCDIKLHYASMYMLCIYTCVYICIHVCMYVCVYIHIIMHAQDSGRAKRREWDARMRTYLVGLKEKGVPMLWLGDLNVSHRCM